MGRRDEFQRKCRRCAAEGSTAKETAAVDARGEEGLPVHRQKRTGRVSTNVSTDVNSARPTPHSFTLLREIRSYTPATSTMKLDRKGPADGRVEYRWLVDHEKGFETAKLIYDNEGRLMGVDYELVRKPAPSASAQRRPDAS
jgi:hypothetical protein